MKRAIPFVILGIIGVAGYFVLGPPSAGSEPASTGGSVTLTTALEHGKLLTTGSNETYARIVLEGAKMPAPKDRPPVSLTLVIDHSGSMFGDKIENARASALAALEQLKEGDRVSIIAFSSGVESLASGLTIGQSSLDEVRRRINALSATGGTNMVAGLNEAIVESSRTAGDGRTQRVLLLSDGQPDTERGLDDLVSQLARSGVSTTTLGLGTDYNEDLMSRLADKGLGNYYFIQSPDQMTTIFETELKTLASVVARSAVVSLQPLEGVEIVNVYGYESANNNGITNVPVGDIYGGRRADLLVKLRVAGKTGTHELLKVDVKYEDAIKNSNAEEHRKLAATFTDTAADMTASLNYEVVERVERVRSAEALEDASVAIAAGNKAQAVQIFEKQQMRIQGLQKAASGKKGSAMLDSLNADFGDYAQEAKAEPAPMATKKAKARARAYKR